jgi:hypothetical protein
MGRVVLAQWTAGQAQARPSSCFGPARARCLSCRVVLVLGQTLRAATFTTGQIFRTTCMAKHAYFFQNEGFILGFILGRRFGPFLFCFFLWKMKASHLTSYFDEGFVFSLKNEGFARDFVFWRRFLWLHNLMKASYFGFVFWWRLLTLASYFDKGFTLWLRTVTNVSFFLRKRRFHTWLCILMKVSFFLWKMKASHLTSYIDKGFTL